jgi:hypothetical protein
LTQIKVKEQLVVRKDMDVKENERQSNLALRHKLVRKDMDINEHTRLYKFTRKTQIKLSNSL